MACLGHGICLSIFMGHLDHVDSLKLKSNQTETAWKLIKIWFWNINQTKSTSLTY